jgi:hypothetical protein
VTVGMAFQYFVGDRIKENEMGGAWGMWGRRDAYKLLVGRL